MIPDRLDPVREFVAAFEEIYKEDSRAGAISLMTLFTTCFGMMAPEERMRCSLLLISMIKDINTEIFEDAEDFVTFLAERAEERKQEYENGGEFHDTSC